MHWSMAERWDAEWWQRTKVGAVLCKLVKSCLCTQVLLSTTNTMASSKPSKFGRFGKSIGNRIREARDAILPTSRASSPHSSGANPPSTADESQQPPGHSSSAVPASGNVTSGQSSQNAIPATPDTSTHGKCKNGLGVAWHGLETALRVLAKSADAFPPLKSAVGGLVACLDVVQVSHSRSVCLDCYVLNYITDSRRQSGRLSRPSLRTHNYGGDFE